MIARAGRVLGLTRLLPGLLASFVLSAAGPAQDPEPPQDPSGLEFFEKKIRPLLSERCYSCHSARTKRKGNLALDTREGLLKGGDNGPALVPGDPEKSLLVRATRYTDPELKMPPPKEKSRLSAQQVSDLEAWIRRGAPHPRPEASRRAEDLAWEARKDWVFRAPKDPPVPKVRNVERLKTAIDAFLLEKLEARGLTFAPPAPKPVLLRRATYDLIGLPPSPEELAAFLADDSPDAFARVVDRLLASPLHGERWARHWLDLARYAVVREDGQAKENKLSEIGEAWRYRDWVIDAFTRDLPYDQFILHQIAGDLMPPAEPGAVNTEGLVASGFLAIGEWGIQDDNPEKMVWDTADENIDAVGRTFMGLTLGCARCHDHKFDPLTTRDYYALAGIFASTHVVAQPAKIGVNTPMIRTPLVSQGEIDRHTFETAQANARMAEAKQRLSAATDEAYRELARVETAKTALYFKSAGEALSRSPIPPERPGGLARERGLSEDALVQWIDVFRGWAGGGSFSPETLPRSDVFRPHEDRGIAIAWKSPYSGKVEVAISLKEVSPGKGDGISWLLDLGEREVAHGDLPAGGSVKLAASPFGPVLAALEVKEGELLRLLILPGGSAEGDDTQVEFGVKALDGSSSWTLGSALANPPAAGAWSYGALGKGTRRQRPPASVLRAVERWLKKARPEGREPGPGDLEAATRELEVALGEGGEGNGLRKDLGGSRSPFFVRDRDDAKMLPPESQKRLLVLRQAQVDASRSLPSPIPLAIAAREGGIPETSHAGFHDVRIRIRGDISRAGDLVPRGFPAVLSPDRSTTISTGSGRWPLARWLASAEHPLTARVMANRIWQHHFGEGIVRTPSNFGKMGEAPTHPELLDWLAHRFVEGGWSVKALHRLILLSAAYQQSACPNRESLEKDPDNRLLGRMNRRRLEAEPFRDAMLAVSGSLDFTRGGPADSDPASRRRMIYLRVSRTSKSPFEALFDGADPTGHTDKRTVSTVAPQALFMLNHPFVREQARVLARRLIALEPKDEGARLRRATGILFSRAPNPEETGVASALLQELRSESVEQAWAEICRVLFCTNEFLVLD